MVNQSNVNKFLELEGIKSIKRANISDELFNYFKDSIVSGRLKAGSLLPAELDLCKYTGVSRGTIREVLSALSYMKLITRTKRGTFVSNNPNLYNSLPFSEILKKVHSKDIIDFRIILECEIVGVVVKNVNTEDIQELQNTLKDMKDSKDVDGLIKADTAFHVNLGISSHNELFSHVLVMIRNELKSQIYDIFSKDKSIRKRAITHHEKIIEAIKKGSVKQAKKAMYEHLTDVSDTLNKLIL